MSQNGNVGRTDSPRLDYFNAKDVPARLKKRKRDPLEDFFKTSQVVSAKMMEKVGYVPE